VQEQRSYLVARGLSPLRESPPPGEHAAWASVMAAGSGGGGTAAGAPGLQHTQRSSSVDAGALRGRLQTLKVRRTLFTSVCPGAGEFCARATVM